MLNAGVWACFTFLFQTHGLYGRVQTLYLPFLVLLHPQSRPLLLLNLACVPSWRGAGGDGTTTADGMSAWPPCSSLALLL